MIDGGSARTLPRCAAVEFAHRMSDERVKVAALRRRGTAAQRPSMFRREDRRPTR
jgi:hypothetical protein